MWRPFLVVLIAASALPAPGAYAQADCAGTPNIAFIVRHAGRDGGADRLLIPQGRDRAAALALYVADRLAGRKLNAVYATRTERTFDTADDTAAAQVPPLEPLADFPQDDAGPTATALLALRCQIVLVVGHSGTIPALLRLLGAPNPPGSIDQNEYDKFFEVTYGVGPTTMEVLEYGVPSP